MLICIELAATWPWLRVTWNHAQTCKSGPLGTRLFKITWHTCAESGFLCFKCPLGSYKTRKTDLHIPCLSCSCDFVNSCTCVEKRQLHHQTQTATLFSTSLAQLLQGWGHLTHRFDGPCGSASPASSDVKKSWLCDFLIVACDLYATTERSSSTWSNNMYNFTFSVLIHCCVWIPLAWCGNCI